MATRGFSQRQKDAIASKIREMDERLDEARQAFHEGRIADACAALERLEEMKVAELITIFPPIALSEPRRDIPFSVLYEIFSRIIGAFFEFLEWARAQARKPPAERDPSERERWRREYRRLLDELRYLLGLAWPPSDLARPLLDPIISELERLLRLIDDFDGAQPPSAGEIEEIWERLFAFLRAASDEDFDLKAAFSKLHSIDSHLRRLPRMFADRDNSLTRRLIENAFEAIEAWKHALGSAVEAAKTR